MFENYDYKKHPANEGIDYSFNGTMTEEVLHNYLSRAVTLSNEEGDELKSTDEHYLHFLLTVGAKYVGRACCAWVVSKREVETHPEQKKFLELVHRYDPEIIFEGTIFENIRKNEIDTVLIPPHILETFGEKVEERYFKYENMIFENGVLTDLFGVGGSAPDITRIETQMYFYWRGCLLIDDGYEAIHMGQIGMIGAHDKDLVCFTKIFDMIREYAKTHARRGYVLINAHGRNRVDANGYLMLDFVEAPCRAQPIPGCTEKMPPTEEKPQEAILLVNKWETTFRSSIYTRTIGGKTHMGWECDRQPYLVELDNYSPSGEVDVPNYEDWDVWGRDEISWFANQPDWYRRKWMQYAYDRVEELDPGVGHFQLPGKRIAKVDVFRKQNRYCAFDSSYCDIGFNDEQAILKVFVNDRKKRLGIK